MKPGFALSLSPDGISLLHRAAGGWRLVGSVDLDSSDLGAALASLRAQAEHLDPGPLSCKLIVPNSQVRYLTLDTGLVADDVRMDMARAALDGATPYPVDELAFDLSLDGPLTHVAAVAVETLEEAESFAQNHGFGPTSFVAAPGDMGFLGEPFFGTARAVRGIDIEPDGIAVVNIGPAKIPTVAVAEVDRADDDVEAANEQPEIDELDGPAARSQAEPKGETEQKPPPIIGFSSRRHNLASGAPSLNGASRISISENLPDSASIPTPALVEKPTQTLDTASSKQVDIADSVKPGLDAPAPVAQVSAPSVPAPDEHIAAAAPVITPTDTAFASRRQPTAVTGPAPPQVRTVISSSQTQATVAAASNRPHSDPFAMREPLDVGGKPRFLGLALIAVLLLFMAAVAAWAVYINPTFFSFGTSEPIDDALELELPEDINTEDPAEAPAPLVPAIETTPDQLPEIIAPQVSALPENLTAQPSAPIADPAPSTGLTESDIAVLDALQQPELTDLDLEAVADGVENIQAEQSADLSQAAQYAAVGIWQSVPQVPDLPAIIGLNNLYVASIDNTDLSQDAVALPPAPSFTTDLELDFVTSPTAAGNAFDLDERGLVRATPEGTLNPDGIMVFLGRPSRVPPPTPDRLDPNTEAQIIEQQEVLARLRPRSRPDDLIEQAERAQLGGLSLAELGQKRPRIRPASSRPANEDSLPTTEQAIATSVVPKARPVNFANLVDRAQRNSDNSALTSAPASAAASTAGILNRPAVTPNAVAPATVTPSIPTSASVARQATMENAINLRKANLIGVYGTPSNRRALVRLSSGRYKKVKVGDKFDGGQVVAIGETELRYQKGGRNVTLKIPNG